MHALLLQLGVLLLALLLMLLLLVRLHMSCKQA
jgi:hypothetical protein